MKCHSIHQVCFGTGLAFLVFLAGCSNEDRQVSSGEPSGATPEERVSQRATARLDAMLAGDWDKALGYANSSYRQRMNAERYARAHAGAANWTAARVERTTCEELRCKVVFLVTYPMAQLEVENTRPMEELWILVDEEWYVYEE